MVYAVMFLLCLSAVIFKVTLALEDCTSYNASRGDLVLCSRRSFFCCGTCDKMYCCNNRKEKITKDELNDCLSNNTLPSHSPHQLDRTVFIEPIVMFLVFIVIVFIIICCSEKRIRNRLMSTTTVTTTQHNPQEGLYSAYQPVFNNPQSPTMPMGQLYAPGPPPSYHEAGCPCPISQSAYDSGQVLYSIQPTEAQPPLSIDYNPPAYNPAYVNSLKTS
ncbi:uncharacterized protein isoform X2 [Danio rerio]|uniref:Uncharacterized protein isoform X2 n=1 Tax=Danio rerio TaxID=7955 RepID=A0AB32TGK6_DANRE